MVLNVEEPLLLNDTEQSFSTDVYEEFNMTGISFCYSFLIDTVLSIEMVKKMASSVSYHHHNVEIKNTFINNISSTTDIMYLDLSCNGIKDEDFSKFSSLFKKLPKLISLNISNNDITGQGLVLVRNEILENCKDLLELDISHNQIKFEDGKLFFFKLFQLPSIKSINMSYNLTGDSDMKLFSLFMETFDHDVYIDLTGNEIREFGLITLHHKMKKNKMKLINFGAINMNKMSIVGLMQYYFSSKK